MILATLLLPLWEKERGAKRRKDEGESANPWSPPHPSHSATPSGPLPSPTRGEGNSDPYPPIQRHIPAGMPASGKCAQVAASHKAIPPTAGTIPAGVNLTRPLRIAPSGQ